MITYFHSFYQPAKVAKLYSVKVNIGNISTVGAFIITRIKDVFLWWRERVVLLGL